MAAALAAAFVLGPAAWAAEVAAAAEPVTAAASSAVTTEVDSGWSSGWEFDEVIKALQPLMYYGGKRQSGLFKMFDRTEVQAPVPLDDDGKWEIAKNPSRMRRKMLASETFFQSLLNGHGAVYYHTMLRPGAREGRDVLLHQFWYYFPTGAASFVGSADQGFSMVELEQVVARTAADHEAFRALVAADLRADRQRLEDMVTKADPGALPVAEVRRMQAALDGILARPIEVPLNYFIDFISTTSAMHPGDSSPPRVLRKPRKAVRWVGTRPVVYVAEGTHTLVLDREDFLSGERCDAPYIVHGSLRERVLNLHNPHEPLNPYPNGANSRGLVLGGVFAEHPLFWLGAERYLAGLAAGTSYKDFQVRWKVDGGK